jgi:hypothetical protein
MSDTKEDRSIRKDSAEDNWELVFDSADEGTARRRRFNDQERSVLAHLLDEGPAH